MGNGSSLGVYFGNDDSLINRDFDFMWYYKDCVIRIEFMEYSCARIACNVAKRNGYEHITFQELLLRILDKHGVNIVDIERLTPGQSLRMNYSYLILHRLNKVVNPNNIKKAYSITEEEIVGMVKRAELLILYSEKPVPKFDYIVGIGNTDRNGNYMRVEVRLKSDVDNQTIMNWYKNNQKNIYEMIREKYNSNPRNRNYPLNCYDIGNVTLLRGNTLMYTFELKKGLVDMEEEMNNN